MDWLPTDVLTVVHRHLPPAGQRRLRVTCKKHQRAFDQTAHQMEVAVVWSHEGGVALEHFGTGEVADLIPLDHGCYHERPAGGTLLINLHLLFTTGHIPDRFLQKCCFRFIVLNDSGSIHSAGRDWMRNCAALKSLDIQGVTALSVVKQG